MQKGRALNNHPPLAMTIPKSGEFGGNYIRFIFFVHFSFLTKEDEYLIVFLSLTLLECATKRSEMAAGCAGKALERHLLNALCAAPLPARMANRHLAGDIASYRSNMPTNPVILKVMKHT